MKEIYKVQTPKRIVFGDPLYFEEFSGPQTGDSSHLWLYICLGAVSLTALVTLFLTKRRKSEQ